jgi:hypothetical protein
LRYLRDHGGEIDIAKCAEELGLSEPEVEEAIDLLQREGKIKKEEVGPPVKPARPEGMPTSTTLVVVVSGVVVLAVIMAVAGYFLMEPYLEGNIESRTILPCTADVSGTIFDKDDGPAENYHNAKCSISIEIMTDDIDDVLNPTDPLKISIAGHGKTWTTGTIDIRSASGLTEAN